MRSLAVFPLLLWLAGCAAAPSVCVPPQQPMTSAEMLFGRKIGEKMTVGEKDFAGFVATEITPRFPDGLTIVDAQGQWRDSETGRLVREPAKLVIVVFRDAPEKRAALRAIADAYKQRFRQQGVAMIVKAACVSF